MKKTTLWIAACLVTAPAAGQSFDGTAPAQPPRPGFTFSRAASPDEPGAAGRPVAEADGEARELAVGPDSLEVLVDGDAFARATLETIRDARRSLDLEMFDFVNERFIAALCARARQIRVRVVLDPFQGHTRGEIAHKKEMVRRAREAGAEVAFYPTRRLHGSPFKIDHVKLLIADGSLAVAGGSNWLEDPGENHDYNLRLRGPVVGRLVETFAQSWALSHGAAPPERAAPRYEPRDGVEVLLTDESHREPLEAVIRQIGKARRIRAEQLLLDQAAVVEALIAARRRGADVKLVLDPNTFFFGGVNGDAATRLLDAGVPVRFFRDPAGRQTLLHAKLAVFDDRTVIVGSANWSRNALEVNHELALLFNDEAAARALEDIIEADWAGRSYTPRAHRGLARLLERLVRSVAGIFS